MVQLMSLMPALAALVLFGGVVAHPGEDHSEHRAKGIEARDLADAYAKRAANCAGTATHKGLQARAAARRALTAQLLREERDIVNGATTGSRPTWLLIC